MTSNDQQLTEAWEEFLGWFEWHHAITLTTRWAYSRYALSKEMQHGFARRLAKMTQGKVGWFYSMEDRVGGYPHLHALLGGTSHLTTTQVQRAWKSGMSRVRVLRAESLTDSSAAVRYAVKHIGRIPAHHDIALKGLRRRIESRV